MPTKETIHKEEIIKMPEFQSSTPTFGQSTNPLDLNMGVGNRFTGAENLIIVDNLTGVTTKTEDFTFEIPFDVKGVTSFGIFQNSTIGPGGIYGMSNGHSCKPFGGTVPLFATGTFRGNYNGMQHRLYSGAGITYSLPSAFVATTGLMGSSGGEISIYPLEREDKRVTLRAVLTPGRYVRSALTFG